MWRPFFMAKLFYVLPFIFTLHGLKDYYGDYLSSLWENEPSNPYDFIIVGAGSAGATIALRLSKHYRVLLLEAGGRPMPLCNIPGIALDCTEFAETDWKYRTVPQKHGALGLNDNVSHWPRGKVLGGSSTLNFMLYLRGHPKDYDNWARITNDSEWNYENVLPYFKKSLKSYNGQFKSNKKHYEESPYGFLNVEDPQFRPFRNEFVQAGIELGFPEVDLNGPQTEGFGPLEVTQRNGERFGTYAAIIKDLEKRDNVKILTYSQVTKIKLDKSGRATGVYYQRFGKRKYAEASKEIIVSGGTVDSPKLLMLSGIGPKSHLESVGVCGDIRPKIDLPVGQNLEDHLVTMVEPFTAETQGVFVKLDEIFGPGLLADYFQTGTGILSVAFGCMAQGFLCSESVFNKTIKCEWPDLQMYLIPFSYFRFSPEMVSRSLNVRSDILNTIIPPTDKEGFHFAVSLVRPNSKGTLTLRDKDPSSSPLIDPNYFANPKDLDIMMKGLKIMVQMAENTTVFQNIGAKYIGTSIPGCEHTEFRSDEYWKCYAQHLSVTMWHPTGTCKMGKDASDKTAVVDSRLRVLHTKGLRVADASIMPVIVNANTNAPTIMIGEKASAFILEYWAYQKLVCSRYDHYFLFQNHLNCYYNKVSE